jgi:hypothetical protein
VAGVADTIASNRRSFFDTGKSQRDLENAVGVSLLRLRKVIIYE